MSKYADLRCQIADLEKELEVERSHNKKLMEEVRWHGWQILAKDKEIEELKDMLKKVGEKMNGKDDSNAD